MRMHLGTALLLFTWAITPHATQAQQLPLGVLAFRTEDITWQEGPVGWEMAVLSGDRTSRGCVRPRIVHRVPRRNHVSYVHR